MVAENKSTNQENPNRDSVAPKKLRIAFAASVGIFCFAIFFFDLPVTLVLLTGWIRFPFKVLPQVRIDWGGIVVFAVSFFVAVTCFHLVAVWLMDHLLKLKTSDAGETQQQQVAKHWTLRASFATVSMFMLVFVVGICMAGVVHQTGWIITSPEGLSVSKFQSPADAKLANYDPKNTPAGRSWIAACAPFVPFMLELDRTRPKPFNDPEDAEKFKRVLPVSICPSQGNPLFSPDGFGLSHVAANTTALGGKLKEKNAMAAMVGEVNAAFDPWGAPSNHRNLDLGVSKEWADAKRGSIGFGSVHSGGANICLIDGSTRFVSDRMDREVLKRIAQASKVND